MRVLPLLLTCHLWLISYSVQMYGQEFTYKAIDSLKFEITFTLYRDCRGSTFSNPSSSCRVYTACGTRSMNFSLVSIEEVTPLNDSVPGGCVPANTISTGQGYEKHVYIDTLDLLDTANSSLLSCCTVYIEYSACCRNNSLSTISGGNFYNRCEINICRAPKNSSPVLAFEPRFRAALNKTIYMNAGAMDTIDHDSLSYAYISPKTSASSALSYNTNCGGPFSVYLPNGFNCSAYYPSAYPAIGFYLDQATGQTIFTPVNHDFTVMVLEVTEWRRDSTGTFKEIGKTIRDMSVEVISTTNNYPEIESYSSFTVCAGEELCFNLGTVDDVFVPPPPAQTPQPDSVKLSWAGGLNGASFSITNSGARLETGRFCWAPSEEDIRNRPYVLYFEARDNSQYTGITQFAVTLKVKPKAKGTIKTDSLSCGFYRCTAAIDSNFVGSPQYTWQVVDSAGNALDPNLYYFTSNLNYSSYLPTDSIKFKFAGTYIVRLKLNNSPGNCPAYYYDTVVVGNTFSVVLNTNFFVELCLGDTLKVPTTVNNGTQPITYKWFDYNSKLADTSSTLIYRIDSLLVLGFYKFQALSSDGCKDRSVVFFKAKGTNLTPLPAYQSSCDSAIEIDLKVSFDSLIWSNGLLDTFRFKVNNSGMLSYQAFAIDGCEYSDSTQIEIFNTRQVRLSDQSVCEDSLLVSAAAGFSSYLWSNGDTSKSTIARSSGSLSVTAIDSNGCTSSDTGIYEVYGTPVLYLAADSNLCCGSDLISLNDLLGSSDPTNGIWNCFAEPNSISGTGFDPNELCGSSPRSAYLSYYYRHPNTGCVFHDSIRFTVSPVSNVQLRSGSYCQSDSEINLEADIITLPANPGVIQQWSCEECYGNNLAVMLEDRGTTADPNYYLLIDTAYYKVSDNLTDRVLIRFTYINIYSCTDSDTASIFISKSPPKPLLRKDGEAITVTNPASEIRWYRDGNLLADKDSVLDAGIFGTYTALNVNEAGCESELSDVITRTSGIDDIDPVNIHVMPNPGNGSVMIVLTGISGLSDVNVRVISSIGQEMESEFNTLGSAIHLNWEAKAGIYYIRLELNGNTYVFKYVLI